MDWQFEGPVTYQDVGNMRWKCGQNLGVAARSWYAVGGCEEERIGGEAGANQLGA